MTAGYLHLLNGRPARFSGCQLYPTTSNAFAPILARDWRQAQTEQRADREFRRDNALPSVQYAIVRVELPVK